MRPLLLLALFSCAMAMEPDESWPPPEAERAREIYDDLGNLTFPISNGSLAQQFPGNHVSERGVIPTKSLPSFFPRLIWTLIPWTEDYPWIPVIFCTRAIIFIHFQVRELWWIIDYVLFFLFFWPAWPHQNMIRYDPSTWKMAAWTSFF